MFDHDDLPVCHTNPPRTGASSGLKWANTNITVSCMPDGAQIGTQRSNLFSVYDSAHRRDVWQSQLNRALQAWASVAPLTFTMVADSGLPQGTPGKPQGDPRFGDIRIGGFPSIGQQFASTYYPYPTTTRGGDITLNTSIPCNIGKPVDLFSVLVHEIGHALGLAHSTVMGSVMYYSITGVYVGLSPDDVESIQAMYGKR